MLDDLARRLSDPAHLLVLTCLTGAAVVLVLDRLVTVRKWRKNDQRGRG